MWQPTLLKIHKVSEILTNRNFCKLNSQHYLDAKGYLTQNTKQKSSYVVCVSKWEPYLTILQLYIGHGARNTC